MKSHMIYISYIALPHVEAHSTELAPFPTVLMLQKHFISGYFVFTQMPEIPNACIERENHASLFSWSTWLAA